MSDISWTHGENWVMGSSPEYQQPKAGEPMRFAVASIISQGDAEADARLINAAPDLLAALEAVEWVPRSDTHGEVDGECCPWCDGDKPYRYTGTDGEYYEQGGHASDCPRQLALQKAKGGE